MCVCVWHLEQANADKVKDKTLEAYRNKCQPVFLLFKVTRLLLAAAVAEQLLCH